MAVLADPLRLVVGDKAAKRLASAFDLHTVGDLLSYYPRRYDKRGELTDLVGLRDGDYVTVQAEVASSSVRRMHNRPGSTIFEAVVTDGHGKLTLTFFGRGRQDFRQRELSAGVRGLFSGQVSSFRGKRQLTHPDYELLGSGSAGARAEEYARELIPVYRASAQMPSWKIADSVRLVLDTLDVDSDPLPAGLRGRLGLTGYADALRGIHRPADEADVYRARTRLKWDEAFTLQVLLAQRRLAAASYSAIPRPPADGRPARRLRLHAAVRAHRRPAAGRRRHCRRPRTRSSDAPAAARRSRLRQDDHRAASDAAGRGRGRAGSSARAHRGAGPAALPVDLQHAGAARHGRAARRSRARDPAGPAHRLAEHARPGGGRCWRPRPARPASSSAPTPCWRTGSSSPTSVWRSSMSSTGSGWSSGTRCGTRPGTAGRTCSS